MTTRMFPIPLDPTPQSFDITLAGRPLRLTVRWFDALEGGWVLDIQEQDATRFLVAGIPLVAGADLLEQYAYLNLGGQLWLTGDIPPTLANLGGAVQLVFITEETA